MVVTESEIISLREVTQMMECVELGAEKICKKWNDLQRTDLFNESSTSYFDIEGPAGANIWLLKLLSTMSKLCMDLQNDITKPEIPRVSITTAPTVASSYSPDGMLVAQRQKECELAMEKSSQIREQARHLEEQARRDKEREEWELEKRRESQNNRNMQDIDTANMNVTLASGVHRSQITNKGRSGYIQSSPNLSSYPSQPSPLTTAVPVPNQQNRRILSSQPSLERVDSGYQSQNQSQQIMFRPSDGRNQNTSGSYEHYGRRTEDPNPPHSPAHSVKTIINPGTQILYPSGQYQPQQPPVPEHFYQNERNNINYYPFQSEPMGEPLPDGEERERPIPKCGNGAWGQLYKESSSARRSLLNLLYRASIVTAKEFSENSSTIDEKHVTECLQIAQEMLDRHTEDYWLDHTDQATNYFNERLSHLYHIRFGIKKEGEKKF